LSAAQASSSINNADPTQRLIYVGGQTIPSGGGAIELNVPGGSWVMYGYQWPEASRANPATNAIVLRQGGVEAPRIQIYRHDGINGDTNFDPIYPFKMRGSVDQFGNVITGANVSNLTYAIDVPVVTNANFDILVRCDASSANALVKLDGGIDLNSQMGLGPTSGTDLRDNKPGTATDVFLGYEQTAFQFRNGPEKFAARNILSNNIVSLGAETYYYTVGGSSNIVSGAGFGDSITNQTASWVFHDPLATNSASGNGTITQRVPLSPASGQSADIYVKVGYQFQINTCFIYYTTDGSNPEGTFGIGKGTTQVVQAVWVNHDSAQSNIDWWKGTIPAQPNGTQVRYKISLFYGGSGGSIYAGNNIEPISDAEPQGSKYYGLTQAAITNFNPTTAKIWLHNDLNPANVVTGLQSGFHIIRARTFLPRANKSSVFNTFSQTFYYDGGLPGGVIACPSSDGNSISSTAYTVVVRADSTVSGIDFNIQDSNSNNDDIITGQTNGNGNDTNGAPVFVNATQVANPDTTLTAQYPNYPQEFRFVYTNVPTSGSATISVRLKTYATAVYSNRVTTLTRTVNTLAPASVVQISSPAPGTIVTLSNSNLVYLIQACFTASLTPAVSNFNILINGELQPQSSYILRPVGAVAGCAGMRSLLYNWTVTSNNIGTNVIQVLYTNSLPVLSDSQTIIVAPPLRISSLSNNNQLVVWDSAPGASYQVLATTNLLQAFQPISPPIQASSSSTYFYDPAPANQKFYEIEMVQ
jgi:hypothetical protein